MSGHIPLISSQRFIDENTVQRKMTSFKRFVVRVHQVELRGKPYKVLVDGHHNFEAAKRLNVKPIFKEPSKKYKRTIANYTKREIEIFLINNLTDCDWFNLETGEVISELLGIERSKQ